MRRNKKLKYNNIATFYSFPEEVAVATVIYEAAVNTKAMYVDTTRNPVWSEASIVFIERFTRPVARLEIKNTDNVFRDKPSIVGDFGTPLLVRLSKCCTEAKRPSMKTF